MRNGAVNLRAYWPQVSRMCLVVFALFFAFTTPSNAGVKEDLQALLQRDAVSIFKVVYSTDPLRKAYQERGFKPVWVTRKGPRKRAFELIRVLSASSEDGLVPADYLGSIPDHWMDADPASLEKPLTKRSEKSYNSQIECPVGNRTLQ